MTNSSKIIIGSVVVLVFVILAAGAWVLLKNRNQERTTNVTGTSQTQTSKTSRDGPTIKMKSLGINLEDYDPATGMAGDLKFTKEKFAGGMQVLFADYGYVISGDISASGQDKANPQPTFAAPLGTKVHSLVDGIVFDVPKLYSNDYSIQVYDGKNGEWLWETEHVINPLVKKGDTVKAGQVIAEVSNYSLNTFNGQGLFEIGLLKGGNPPMHYCPFAYVDESAKDEIFGKLRSLMKSWEEYRADPSAYPDESSYKTLGCRSSDPIEG